MKNGYWEIGYGKTATTTVKVKGENIIVTAPAGWVATVSEADEMTNVATLSITAPANAMSTRATADNGSDVTVQVNKGASWAVAKIQVKAIQVVDSYYALYNSGATFTVNGIEVNNTKFENATYIDSDQTITTPGIYFIKGGVTVNYNSTVMLLICFSSEMIHKTSVQWQLQEIISDSDKIPRLDISCVKTLYLKQPRDSLIICLLFMQTSHLLM